MGGTWLSRIPIWNLVKLKVKKHSDLTDVTASQHHTKYTNGEAVTAMGAKGDANPLHHDKTALGNASLTYVINSAGAGSAITTGLKGFLEVPFSCAITRVTMLAKPSGSIVVDIWKDTYSNFPPDNADSITAAAPPTITTAQKSQDSTLTGWTKALAAGAVLAFNVDSCTTIELLALILLVERT